MKHFIKEKTSLPKLNATSVFHVFMSSNVKFCYSNKFVFIGFLTLNGKWPSLRPATPQLIPPRHNIEDDGSWWIPLLGPVFNHPNIF